ncbi:hypothetical protein [Agromyces archimandritae]|uniref:Uncharacterized protein n=1 Tax=Agromyces archimandritae TaxID=2781962 RepID=A0A975FPK3_9MICO|nr:hypothetical protein [Agromyces archimandritae]QTX05682.1 hypothetical protein G127AT_05610 [Agromyces archimandritae]
MDARKLLLAAATAALFGLSPVGASATETVPPTSPPEDSSPAPTETDSGGTRTSNLGQIKEGRVDLSITETTPGSDGADSGSGTDDDYADLVGLLTERDEPEISYPYTRADGCVVTLTYVSCPVGTGAVTITDVARFLPAAPAAVSQPDGWGIVKKPVNFMIDAETHIISSTLLDRPAQVRFTPVAFSIDTEQEGTIVAASGLGDTWENLRQDEFTETPTSHVFTERGTHAFTPTVVYAAAYRFADDPNWYDIPGSLTRTGPAQDILIGKIETVLVPNKR